VIGEDEAPLLRDLRSVLHGEVARRATPRARRRIVSSKNVRSVEPDGKGGWKVTAPGSKRASGRFDKQGDAEKRPKQIVRRLGGGEVRIHGADGKIRDSDTVPPGKDAFPPRDRKR
jgi:hypothetical protein